VVAHAWFGVEQVGEDVYLTFSAVPEPGSVGLAASVFAAAGFGIWRRRRKAGRRGSD